jgi:hypothetical protein
MKTEYVQRIAKDSPMHHLMTEGKKLYAQITSKQPDTGATVLIRGTR